MRQDSLSLELAPLAERIGRLERALAELASDLHRVASLEQLAAGGKPALAAILAEYRDGVLETTEHRPAETR